MSSRIVKTLAATLVAVTALSGAACSSTSKDTAPTSIKDAKDRAADRTEKGLTEITPASLRKIIDAAATRSGKKPARITEIQLAGGDITVDIVDPKKPSELNSWHVSSDGEVKGESTPVDYGGDEEALRQNAFGSDEVKTQAVVDAIAAAPGAAKLDGGKILGVSVSRRIPATEEIRSMVTVQSPRGTKTVWADMTGKVVTVR
ncbi:hypothetical protein AXK57_02310 [Tsukamurella pulmonis]|uniref:Peptidase propeptide and YPEB domain-containing protein n=1 Tax=Tsukamurella pulmonis TaxID=47312 RepID=A0A1H1H145_9ACTN|nr:hypothetical protein [Tsukamurella pulmonis]KXO88117.1 hypothetical protein AXK56_12135 [Tsukamurella pulmonis]KXP13086.1 hypothetical protein AXK57_02310 [Tsukamurella pulmonis]RDH13024.1 hypothetical protein DVB88_04600 [Tsukamurella pulmonis]SDR19083.1 hypothetical protein SAMN04489765_3725 [Tsukamurella pulmonis]SUP16192.1 Uncharacterised protein [Tsukamurella pulmonis]